MAELSIRPESPFSESKIGTKKLKALRGISERLDDKTGSYREARCWVCTFGSRLYRMCLLLPNEEMWSFVRADIVRLCCSMEFFIPTTRETTPAIEQCEEIDACLPSCSVCRKMLLLLLCAPGLFCC